MLVEEPRVEVEDPLADDVEAEVPRLDHAGVDRADGDLVGVVGRAPASVQRASVEVVLDERPQRLVAVEADAVEVVRLALVPAGRGDEVDDRRHRACRRRRRVSRRVSPSGEASSDAHGGAAVAGGRMQAGEAPAVGERRATASRYASAPRCGRLTPSPRTRPSTIAESGQPRAQRR